MVWLFIAVSLASIDDDPELAQACYTAVEQSRIQLRQSSFEISEKLEWPGQVPARELDIAGRIDVFGNRTRYSWRARNTRGGESNTERVVVLEDGDTCILSREFEGKAIAQAVPAVVSVFSSGVQPRVDPFMRRSSDLIWFTDHVLEYRHIARQLQGPPVSPVNGKPFARDIIRQGEQVEVQLVFPMGFETTLKFSLDHGGNIIEHTRKEPPQGSRTSWVYSRRTYQWAETSDGIWWPRKFVRRDTKDSESGELIFANTVEVTEFLGIAKKTGGGKKSVSLTDLGELTPGTVVTEYRVGAEPKTYTVGKEKTEIFEEMARRMGSSLRQGSLYKATK